MIMWFLWLERNDCTFSGTPFRIGHVIWRVNLQIAILIQGGILTIENWKGVSFQHPLLVGRQPKRRVIRAIKVTWSAPMDNWIKVNTDGALSTSRNIVGGGGVIRDLKGKMVSAFSTSFTASSSLEAELKAFKLGLTMAAWLGDSIWMEMDAVTIVHMLIKNEHGPTSIRHIIHHIRQLISGLNYKISFIV